MHSLFISKRILYDGTQLSSLWSYRKWGLQGDSIVSFRGPCQVDLKKMVDIEDVLKESPVYSPDMLHFIIEHFDLDLEKTILRQRIFIAIIKEMIESKEIKIKRSGDDLYINNQKLSISIATLTPVSTMIHTGLNVISNNVPVKAIGLLELGYIEEELPVLAQDICKSYISEIKQVYKARCKVRGVS